MPCRLRTGQDPGLSECKAEIRRSFLHNNWCRSCQEVMWSGNVTVEWCIVVEFLSATAIFNCVQSIYASALVSRLKAVKAILGKLFQSHVYSWATQMLRSHSFLLTCPSRRKKVGESARWLVSATDTCRFTLQDLRPKPLASDLRTQTDSASQGQVPFQ